MALFHEPIDEYGFVRTHVYEYCNVQHGYVQRANMDMSKEPMSKMDMSKKMTSMDPMKGHMAMDNSMTRFLPLAGMWAIMMAAMMLPTMVPTLRSYEDLMTSANGTRVGWLGVLLGYSIVWVLFSVNNQRYSISVTLFECG